ncbi:MAG: response regulator [Pseudomonadota bacterium]
MSVNDFDDAHMDNFFEAISRLAPRAQDSVASVSEKDLPGDGFSEEAFMSRMLGDKRLAKEVASLFLNNSPNMIAGLVEALSRKDPRAVIVAAQALKGSAGSLGAEAVYLKAKEIQSLASAERMDEVERLFPPLLEEVNRLRMALVFVTGKKRRWKILIAEDDAGTRKLIQGAVVKWGHDAVVCSNGREALQGLQQSDSPKMAILDWMMPEVDGVEVCRRLRKNPLWSHTYILMLTSRDSTEDIIEALDAGADDYLTKPFNLDELKFRLTEGLRRIGLQPVTDGQLELAVDQSLDEMNKVLNAESILVALKKEITAAQAKKAPVGVVVVEIENVLRILEKFESEGVEAVIGEVVQILHASIPPWGLVGQLSPTKFLVVASGCNKEETIRVADTVASSIASAVIKSGPTRIPVKVTVGATLVQGGDKIGVESVIFAADTALDIALREGSKRPGFSPASPQTGPGIMPQGARRAPSSRDSRLDFQLIIAARDGSLDRVARLLKAGADVDARDKQGNTPLIEAAFYKYPELVDFLLAAGADAAAANSVGDTALTEAIRAGHKDVVKKLLNVSMTELPDLGTLYRAVFEASTYGKTEVVEMVRDQFFSRL